MISWMQKHNRYLVWTIWVATIAFIGAGFVGWGNYKFGSKAGNIAKVGEIEIPQIRFNMTYSNLYNQYNEAYGGNLDEAKAKELGLTQQAFARLETQAKLLNLAKEIGVIVSDEEVAEHLESIPAFQKNGVFNKTIYKGYLQSQRLKANLFEGMLRDELAVSKTLALFEIPPYDFEEEIVGAAINVADKISYKVLTQNDVTLTPKEAEVKAFWEAHKEDFKTPKLYDLSILWTGTDEVNITEDELKNFYETNSFNYTDANGKQLSFEDAKDLAEKDLSLKKSKKTAQKAYIAFKKGEAKSNETITLPEGDRKLSPELWNELQTKAAGDLLKPKIVGNYYATVKINKIVPPRVKRFEEAKAEVTTLYMLQAKKEALATLAEKTLKNFHEVNATQSDYLSFEKNVKLNMLNKQESLQFLQKLFTSNKEKGMISAGNKIVVYKIGDQKILPLDKEKVEMVKQTTAKIKKRTFESDLIQLLDEKYPTEVYVGGLKN